ncbi:MAG: type II toxin-antitoxin system VapC family toxin [Sulfurisoma sp.]|nr:type II toxin-antitoxin system VapC family toxin [Sulfurisoma sp.]
MAFVVDCSVVARWFLPDEATRYSEAVLDRLERDTAHVPALWLSEFANVMLKLERQRLLKPGIAAGIFGRAEILGLVVDRQTPAPARLHDLARQFSLSAYDATYLELALRLGTPLACIDGGLKQAARRVGLLLAV